MIKFNFVHAQNANISHILITTTTLFLYLGRNTSTTISAAVIAGAVVFVLLTIIGVLTASIIALRCKKQTTVMVKSAGDVVYDEIRMVGVNRMVTQVPLKGNSAYATKEAPPRCEDEYITMM